MQLRTSPIQIITQEVLDVSVLANLLESGDFGPGKIDVDRTLVPFEGEPRKWGVSLAISFGQTDGKEPPPYSGTISLFGVYRVHDGFADDPQRLVRITGASMLYGVARELISHITARSPNGMLTLPSVSFYEEAAAKKKVAKKVVKKVATRATNKSAKT